MKNEERMSYEELEIDRDRMKVARDSFMLQTASLKVENYELKQTIQAANKTCQVCRLRPAEVKGKNSLGSPQWRCQTCHDLKDRKEKNV